MEQNTGSEGYSSKSRAMVTVDRLKNGGWGDSVPGRCLLALRGQRRSDRSLDVCLLGKDSRIQSWPRLCS